MLRETKTSQPVAQTAHGVCLLLWQLISCGPAASRQGCPAERIVAGMKAEIERYLSTGDSDPLLTNWPGNNVLERLQRGEKRLKAALLAEVRRRAARVRIPRPEGMPGDLVAFARAKLEPMVRGLFPRAEQPPVLALLERSIVFLTPETIEPLIRGPGFLETAWAVANIYLVGIGAKPLGDEWRAVGMSEETTCYVSLAYFADDHPFSDFVVHEAATSFTTRSGGPRACRRQGAGNGCCRSNSENARRLPMPARPTVACWNSPAARGSAALLEELKQGPLPPRDQVDAKEYLEILAEAVGRRNGWKAILERARRRSPEGTRRGTQGADAGTCRRGHVLADCRWSVRLSRRGSLP